MDRNDLDFAARCTAGEGWITETREEFEGFLAHDPAGCLLALAGDEPAAMVIATCYGEHGFVGELIVDRQVRLLGLGKTMLERAIEYLRSYGCHSIALDGVPRAVPYYESVGFRRVCRSLRLVGRIPGRADPAVRPMRESDLDAVSRLDRRAFGADRSFFLRRRLQLYPELGKVLNEDGEVRGFILGRRRPGLVWAGPWYADPRVTEPERLLRSLALESEGSDLGLGILDRGTHALSIASALGFRQKPNPSWRMVLGDSDGPGLAPELLAIGTAAKG